jgi:hypothetical protein
LHEDHPSTPDEPVTTVTRLLQSYDDH